MDTNQRKGCLMQVVIALVIPLWSCFFSTVVEWDKFLQQIATLSFTASGISTAIVEWVTSLTTLPRWIFILLIIFSTIGLMWLFRQIISRRSKQSEEKVEMFRDLLLIVTIDPVTKLPVVVNRDVRKARCAICRSSIVSTDVGQFGGIVRYLKCENGDYVGNEMKWSDYQEKLERQRQEAEQEWVEQEKKAKRLLQKLKKELETGKITQEQFDAKVNEAPALSEAGLFYVSDQSQPYNAQDFYNRVIHDFEEQFVKEKLGRLPKLSEKPASN